MRHRSSSIRLAVALSIVPAILAGLPVAGMSIGEERPAAFERSSVPWCRDIGSVRADADDYRDSPVYVWGNPHVRTVQKWAKQQPGYQDLWIDDDNFGWIALGFTEGADERQAEIEQLFPGIGVVAVEVDWTKKDLRTLQRRIGEDLFPGVIGSAAFSVDFGRGMVAMTVGEVTGEVLDAIEASFPGESICVSGPDPSELPPPGPQPTEGDGWTLVGHQDKSGPPWYRTGIATRPAQLARLWTRAEMPGEPPAVDYEENVVLWFAEPRGSGCLELRLDGVTVDTTRSIVWPEVSMPDHPVACTADLAGAHHFFVALERDRLPAAPFWIQLDALDPPGGAPKERTVVEVDLKGPGTVVKRGEFHFDRERQKADPLPLRTGASLRRGGAITYAFDVSCGIGYLGRLSDIHWVSAQETIPPGWDASLSDGGEAIVTVRVAGGLEPHIKATANGHTVRYEPVREEPAGCE